VGADPVVAGSARKHGVTDDDMQHAFRHPIRIFEFDEGLTMIIGLATTERCWRSEWSSQTRRR